MLLYPHLWCITCTAREQEVGLVLVCASSRAAEPRRLSGMLLWYLWKPAHSCEIRLILTFLHSLHRKISFFFFSSSYKLSITFPEIDAKPVQTSPGDKPSPMGMQGGATVHCSACCRWVDIRKKCLQVINTGWYLQPRF